MYRYLHASIGSGLMGLLLAIVGFNITTWQFWAFISLANIWYFTQPQDAS
jgi:hypothetical protein